jgi:hypothetical protein
MQLLSINIEHIYSQNDLPSKTINNHMFFSIMGDPNIYYCLVSVAMKIIYDPSNNYFSMMGFIDSNMEYFHSLLLENKNLCLITDLKYITNPDDKIQIENTILTNIINKI